MVRKAEAEVEKLTRERDRLAAILADPKLYDGPQAKVAEATRAKGKVDADLEAAEERWLAAAEAYETAEAEALADA